MDNKPIIALDFSTIEEIENFLAYFPEESLNVKIGMECFYQNGPAVIEFLKEKGQAIFLDIKLHDIPTTVRKAMAGIARLGVDMINMHALGGKEMMQEARKGLEEGVPDGGKRPLLIAVTQLTSTDEHQARTEQHLEISLEESVTRLAQLANEAGVDGVVCSAHEAHEIQRMTREDFLCVTPGIRLKGDASNDQKRVASPNEAKKLGSTHIVVGRSITQADNPTDVYKQILKLWEG